MKKPFTPPNTKLEEKQRTKYNSLRTKYNSFNLVLHTTTITSVPTFFFQIYFPSIDLEKTNPNPNIILQLFT